MREHRPYYLVASHRVLDRNTINDTYVPRAIACLNKFDVEILTVNETTEIIEGRTGHDRLVILRFPNHDEAIRWYKSPEYQSMVHLRLNSVEGTLIGAEGLSQDDLVGAGVKTTPLAPMANGAKPYFFVASHKVLDRNTINDTYVPRAVACLNKFDVEVLMVNETTEVIEGQTGHDRLVILRFSTRDEAMRWYKSPEYQSMIHLRLNSVEGTLVGSDGLSHDDLVGAGVRTTPLPVQFHGATPAPVAVASPSNQADEFRSGVLTTTGFDGWSDEVKREFEINKYNGAIGSDFVFENDAVRIWLIRLEPGEKMPAHRHILTYLWTAVTPGRFLQRTYDGTTYESDYPAGETHFYDVDRGEFALHNLENVGNTTMIFCAVELKKESANIPLSFYNCQPRYRPELEFLSTTPAQADTFRSGELATSGFEGWSDQIKQEFRTNEFNGRIGSDLVFENDSVRVWHMSLKPGQDMPVHRHILTYFWTAITPGRFLQRTFDGTTYESNFEAGLTHYYDVGKGEFALHNLENVGNTTMIFVAVEFKKLSANTPLPV